MEVVAEHRPELIGHLPGQRGRDPQLLVFLLADEANAVVHGGPEPPTLRPKLALCAGHHGRASNSPFEQGSGRALPSGSTRRSA